MAFFKPIKRLVTRTTSKEIEHSSANESAGNLRAFFSIPSQSID
jgi:hypothetical protein